MKISIVSPVYQAEKIIEKLVESIEHTLKGLTSSYEIVLVEDGSNDESWEKISEVCKKNERIIGIKLSRNFGQHYAVTAGLQHVSGDVVVIMDCDLQDSAKNIYSLIEKMKEGYDVVFTKRIKRQHNPIKAFNALIYNLLYRLISDRTYDTSYGSMVLLRKNVVDEILKIKDVDRLYLQLIKWVGFKQSYILAAHEKRYEGKSSYSFGKLLKLAVAGWTSHSNKLLHMSIYTGVIFSLISFLSIGYITYLYFAKSLLPGWPSIISVILFSTGLILIAIGVLGIYIGKIFDQSKSRPLFIIEKKVNERNK